ncbi:hypothetical protein KAR91_79900 [Candidatus Pacearchaeota archaeon]|nr:hypothetical protein [Candidatus Pacearchaeota archaeon]
MKIKRKTVPLKWNQRAKQKRVKSYDYKWSCGECDGYNNHKKTCSDYGNNY